MTYYVEGNTLCVNLVTSLLDNNLNTNFYPINPHTILQCAGKQIYETVIMFIVKTVH